MYLSSLERLLRYTGTKDDRTSDKKNVGQLMVQLSAVSAKVEKYCNRSFELKTDTEYFSYRPERLELFLSRIPVASITSIKTDGTGQFNGSESTLDTTQYTTGRLGRSVILLYPIYFIYPWREKTIQINFTGGLAAHAVNSVFAISAPATAFTVGFYVFGSLSYACGIVRAASSSSITIENLYGIFQIGDVLSEAGGETGAAVTGAASTITAITSQSLAESDPSICQAVDMEIRFLLEHKSDFENEQTHKDGSRRRRGDKDHVYDLQPEARAMLSDYQRIYMGE